METTRTETYNLELKLLTGDKKIITDSIPNPIPSSETIVATINNINSSLSGAWAGMWHRDKGVMGEYTSETVITKIVQAKAIEKTVTKQEFDGGNTTITAITEKLYFDETEED